jgi:plastocyanin
VTRTIRSRIGILTATLALISVACRGGDGEKAAEPPPAGPTETPAAVPTEPASQGKLADPRKDGFEIGFGEFAVTLEAPAIRPGPVTFVVRNGGELVHGFEMRLEEEGDSSGPGGGGDDRFKVERPTFGPGETIRIELDLIPGVYKIECYVANHSDIGMETFLEVRSDAPKVKEAAAGGALSIRGFAFDPPSTSVPVGGELTWTNADPAPHTVTADDGSFDSGPMDPGGTFSATFDQPGSFAYHCEIHPTMKGTVTVEG